jgi:hypothetical protein
MTFAAVVSAESPNSKCEVGGGFFKDLENSRNSDESSDSNQDSDKRGHAKRSKHVSYCEGNQVSRVELINKANTVVLPFNGCQCTASQTLTHDPNYCITHGSSKICKILPKKPNCVVKVKIFTCYSTTIPNVPAPTPPAVDTTTTEAEPAPTDAPIETTTADPWNG